MLRRPRIPWQGATMGDRWEPPGYGPQQGGGAWGPPGGSPPTGPYPSGGPGHGGPGPAGPGGFDPGGYSPGGFAPGGYPADWSPDQRGSGGFGETELVGRPPFVWLLVALVLGLVAAVVAWMLGTTLWIALATWALAGPVAIGLLAVFTLCYDQQRAKPIYDAPSWVPAL
jgi:hypothetical protein